VSPSELSTPFHHAGVSVFKPVFSAQRTDLIKTSYQIDITGKYLSRLSPRNSSIATMYVWFGCAGLLLNSQSTSIGGIDSKR